MRRGLKVLVIKAVCKCIDLSDLSAKVCCSEAQCEGDYEKGTTQAP